MAVFAVPYGPDAKSDSRPETLEMAMMDAASLRSRGGIAARTRRTVCMRSTLRLACQFSSVSGMARALTLATTTSIPPNASADSSTHAASPSPSPTSRTVPVTLPRSRRASWVAATSSALRAQKPTVAPSSRKVSTMARPMPRVPPVTRTRLSLSCRSMTDPSSGGSERAGAGHEVRVDAVERVDVREERLGRLDDHAVVGVHDVRDGHLGDLGAQLVGVHHVETVEVRHPVHELGVPDAPGVLHRPAGAHGHPVGVVLDPRPTRGAAPDQLDDQGGRHRALDRLPAGLALALAVVTVADGEPRALDVDAEEDRRAGPHLRGVPVSPEPVRDERGAHLTSGRGDAYRAEHRLDRQVDAVVAVAGREGHRVAVAVELVDPRGVGKGVLQRDHPVGAGHAAEERDRSRRSPVAGRLQRDEVESQGVAGLGALDVERPGLRVDEPQVHLLARQVVDAAQDTVEGVLGPQPQRVARLDAHGRGCAAERVHELVASRRVLDDVHRRKLPQPPRRRTWSRLRSSTRVTPSRAMVVVTSAWRMSAARCTPRSPPAIRP